MKGVDQKQGNCLNSVLVPNVIFGDIILKKENYKFSYLKDKKLQKKCNNLYYQNTFNIQNLKYFSFLKLI